MQIIRPFLAFCLAIVWLPMTAHRGLEAAGLFAAAGAEPDSSCCCETGRCAHVGCGVVGSGGGHVSKARAKAAPSPWLACARQSCLRLIMAQIERGLRSGNTRATAPLDWVADWHFVRRTAPPSRAPSLSLA